MKLYKDNRIDGEYELTTTEIADGFLASEYADWHTPLLRALHVYIGAGLNSTTEDHAGLDRVVDAIIAARR